MAYKDINGNYIGADLRVCQLNAACKNGTARLGIRPSKPEDYGAKIRATMSPKTISRVSEGVFSFESPARDTRLGGFLQEKGGVMRGRVKGASNIFTGASTSGGMKVVDEFSNPAMTRATLPTRRIQYEQEISDMGGSAEVELLKRDLQDFKEVVSGFGVFTSAKTEQAALRKAQAIVATGKQYLTENAVAMQGITRFEGENTRWNKERQKTLYGTGKDSVHISTIRDRMLSVIKYLGTALGLADVGPAAIMVQAPAAAPVEAGFFAKNGKWLLIGGLVVLGYFALKKKK